MEETTVTTDSATQRSITPFVFHGNGADYFRIWIVNLLFTILTLGIYSAWAKVRTKKYFYGNTELAGDRFDYIASPIAILKGRLIAVALLLIYSLAGAFSSLLGFVLGLTLFLCIPVIVVAALRFNANNSIWRGVRFGFDGSILQAYKPYFLWLLFALVTLGLGYPHARYKINQYNINHHRFGQAHSYSTATSGGFYLIALICVGAFFATFILYFCVMFIYGLLSTAIGMNGQGFLPAISIAIFMLVYIAIILLYQALYFRLVFNNIEVVENRLRNNISLYVYVMILLTNFLLTLVTLGIYHPWAAVRRVRYLQSNLWIEAQDLNAFTARESDNIAARGEELGEAFDLGIGI
ncbi:MAG: YjgN family protein [Gammaproteobacteria bacterium]|nr:YjgN family protein [Gammaproteobacteria bacterium]